MQGEPPSTGYHRGQVERGEVKIHYRRCGTGKPCLLIQGVGVRGDAWRTQTDTLAKDYELCSIDNRGVGESNGAPSSITQMADDALAVLDKLGWERAHVVGHSMGGAVAMALAAKSSSRVSSLALLCTVARGRDIFSLSPRVLAIQMRTRLGTKESRRRAFFELVSGPSYSSTDEGSLLELEQVFGRRLDELPRVVPRQMFAFARFNSKPMWPALSAIRTLVLSAKHDIVCPAKSGERLAQGIDGALYKLVDGGHAVPAQDPATINAVLERFWSSR